MLRRLRRIGILFGLTIDRCARLNTPFLAAAISFYAMLSAAPGLWIVVAAAGAFVGRASARAGALGWVTQHLGPIPAQYLGQIIDQVNESSGLATIGGAAATFLAATAAFGALQASLCQIWNLPGRPDEGIFAAIQDFLRNFFTVRAIAFLVMLIFGILLGASLVAGAVLSFVETYMPANLPAPHLLLQAAGFLTSVILMMLLFGCIYQLLHRSSFAHREIWVGAGVTALLFAIGNAVIGPYLGTSGLRSAYGAAGAFVLILLWVYYSTQILLFGAAFTEVYARHRRRS
jgi:membrane protein